MNKIKTIVYAIIRRMSDTDSLPNSGVDPSTAINALYTGCTSPDVLASEELRKARTSLSLKEGSALNLVLLCEYLRITEASLAEFQAGDPDFRTPLRPNPNTRASQVRTRVGGQQHAGITKLQ